MDFDVPESNCPSCGARVNAADALTADKPPTPGVDILVCEKCAAINLLDADYRLQSAPDDHPARSSPNVRRVQAAVRELQARRN